MSSVAADTAANSTMAWGCGVAPLPPSPDREEEDPRSATDGSRFSAAFFRIDVPTCAATRLEEASDMMDLNSTALGAQAKECEARSSMSSVWSPVRMEKPWEEASLDEPTRPPASSRSRSKLRNTAEEPAFALARRREGVSMGPAR